MTKDYFRIEGNPQLNKESFTFSESSKYPYFTRTVFNNGIFGYVDYLDDAHLIKGNSLAVGMMACKFFYMSHDFYAGQFTKTAFPLFEGFNEQVALWFTTWFNKSSKKYLGVLVRNFEEEFYNTTLILPFNKDGKLAIKYIEERMRELEEERMRELEEERMRELEAYLAAAGFANCDLTPEEQVALRKFSNGEMRTKAFEIGALFSARTGDVDLQNKDINGRGEYFINSGVQNFGIKGRTDRPARIFSANTLTIDFFGNANYRPFNYKMATHNHVFSLSSDSIKNESVGLYLVSCMSYMNKLFSFNNMGTWSGIKDLEIILPITPSGEIDYDFMGTYISAIKKQIIARLKAEIAREHKAYESVING